METNETEKNEYLFLCKKCNFKCSYKSDYNRHILTAKHKMETNGNKNYEKNESEFVCYCGKKYSSRSGLWKHKKSCSLINKSENETIVKYDNNDNSNILDVISQNKEIMDALVLQNEQLMKQNTELTNTIKEIVPKIGNTTNNNNNNTFNLQVFLNEECKDAINFSDFIKQIQVSFEDLEKPSRNWLY